ncbi:hypothetical protein MTO96_000322 [Rhipicephalus appendiculatus]
MVNYESPTRFWLRLSDSKSPFIRHFVRGCERHLYSVEIGQYCLADTRHTVVDLARAVVTDVFRSTAGVQLSAEVYCIDHGLTLVLGLDRLFPLSAVDASTPCVAVLCRLHRVATCTRQAPQLHLPPNAQLEAVFVGISDVGAYQTRLLVLRNQVDGTLAKFDVASEFISAGELTDISYLRQ